MSSNFLYNLVDKNCKSVYHHGNIDLYFLYNKNKSDEGKAKVLHPFIKNPLFSLKTNR